MKRNRKNHHTGRIISLLLLLCMAVSIAPISAFAAEPDNIYQHTYHTKVKRLVTVTVQDSEGNTVNAYPLSDESDFIEGNVSDDAVQAELERIGEVILAQLPTGTVTGYSKSTSLTFDHFDSSTIYDDDFNSLGLDVHEYQIYKIEESYTIVPNPCESVYEITTVDFGNVWKTLDSMHPVAFTTELNPNSDCPNQMTIQSEGWSSWLDYDEGDVINSSYDGNQYPTAGRTYEYDIELTAKDGYRFPYVETEYEGIDVEIDGEFAGTII